VTGERQDDLTRRDGYSLIQPRYNAIQPLVEKGWFVECEILRAEDFPKLTMTCSASWDKLLDACDVEEPRVDHRRCILLCRTFFKS